MAKTSCGVDGCRSTGHHRLLHNPNRAQSRSGNDAVVTVNHLFTEETSTMLAVVPITLENPDTHATIQTYGLIDSGSEPVLIRADIAHELGLKQRPADFAIGHFDGQSSIPPKYASVTFRDAGKRNFLIEDALNMPRVNTAGRQVNWPLMQREWPYLEGITLPNVRPEQVTVIIGADFKRAHDTFEVRRGAKESDPQAELTPFGWILFGKISNRYRLNETKRKRHVNAVRRSQPDETLKIELERLWTTELFGIKEGVQLPIGADDRRARQILDTSVTHNGERYCASLLWRSETVYLPENREMALKRFYGI